MASKSGGSANTRSVTASRISRSLLGSLMASRSMIPIPGKSRYRDVDVSAAPSIDAAVTAVEDSGATDIATSHSPASGGGAEPSSTGIITTSSPPEPISASGSNAAWGRSSL
jgi:hypothetical protein